jgi:hypothetical protein
MRWFVQAKVRLNASIKLHIDMTLRVRQVIKINSIPARYNGKGENGEDGFVHFFTSDLPDRGTTFTVPEISNFRSFPSPW